MGVQEQILKLQFDTQDAVRSAEAFNTEMERQEKAARAAKSGLGELASQAKVLEDAIRTGNNPLIAFEGTLRSAKLGLTEFTAQAKAFEAAVKSGVNPLSAFEAALDGVAQKQAQSAKLFAEQAKAYREESQRSNKPVVTFQKSLDGALAREAAEAKKAAADIVKSEEAIQAKTAALNKQLTDQFSAIRLNIQETGKAFSDVEAPVDGLSAKISHFVLAGAAFLAVKEAAHALFEALEKGGEIVGVENSFERLNTRAGELASDTLPKLQEATNGAVSKLELMKEANFALIAGIKPDAYVELTGAVNQLAKALGKDTGEALQSVTTALVTQNSEALRSVDVILSQTQAQTEYAQRIGKTVNDLSLYEKQQAYIIIGTEKVIESSKKVGEVQDNAALAVQRLGAAQEDAYNSFAKGVTQSKELAEGLDSLAKAAASIDFETFGSAVSSLAGTLTNSLVPAARLASEELRLLANLSKEGPQGLEEQRTALERVSAALTSPIAFYKELNKAATDFANTDFGKVATNPILGGFEVGTKAVTAGLDTLNSHLEATAKISEEAAKEAAKFAGSFDLLGESSEAIKGLDQIVVGSNQASAATAKLDEKLSQLGKDIDVKTIQDKIEQAIKAGDKGTFNTLRGELERAFREARGTELAATLKRSVEDAGVAKQLDKETALFIGNFDQKFDDSVTKAGKHAAVEQKKAVTEAEKAAFKLTDELNKANYDELQTNLEKAITNVDPAAFNVISQQMEAQFRQIRTEELSEQLKLAATDPRIKAAVDKDWANIAKESGQQMQDALDDAFEESADFFGDTIYDALSGKAPDIEDMFKKLFSSVAGGFVAAITGSAGGNLGSLEGVGNLLGGILGGRNPSAAQAGTLGPLGSLFGLGEGGGPAIALTGSATALDGAAAALTGAAAALSGSGIASSLGSLGSLGSGFQLGGSGIEAGGFDLGGAFGGIPGAGGLGGTAGGAGLVGNFASLGLGAGLASGAAIILTGAAGLDFGHSISQGQRPGLASSAVLAPVTGGLSLLPQLAPSGFFGGGLNANQAHTGGLIDDLIERGILGDKGTFSTFGGGEGRLQASRGGDLAEGSGEFAGLTNLFSLVTEGDIDEQFSGLFANALAGAGSFNEALLTVDGLLEKSGTSAEQAGQIATEAYLDGTISIQEYNSALAVTAQLGQTSLGTLEESAELLAGSLDGPPRDALKALQIEFGTLKSKGITESSQIVDYFTNTFGPEAGQSVQDLVTAGIDLFGDFSSLTVPQIQLVLNEINQMKGDFAAVGHEGESAADRIANGTAKATEAVKKQRREVQGLAGDWGNVNTNPKGSNSPGVQS